MLAVISMGPPEIEERAPGKESAPSRSSKNPTASYTDDIAQQLRRRREAAKRLPPLSNGKRDPWDPYPRDGAA
jgi:hypothetical protein